MATSLPNPLLDPTEEAEILSLYLVGRPPTAEQAMRYAEACRLYFFKDEHRSKERRVCDFVFKRPWALGFMDAGSAFCGRDSLLRRKLIFMAGILEADVTHLDKFLPDRSGSWIIPVRVALAGMRGALKTLVGVPLYLLVARS